MTNGIFAMKSLHLCSLYGVHHQPNTVNIAWQHWNSLGCLRAVFARAGRHSLSTACLWPSIHSPPYRMANALGDNSPAMQRSHIICSQRSMFFYQNQPGLSTQRLIFREARWNHETCKLRLCFRLLKSDTKPQSTESTTTLELWQRTPKVQSIHERTLLLTHPRMF